MSFGHFWFGDQAGRPTRPTGWSSPALDAFQLPIPGTPGSSPRCWAQSCNVTSWAVEWSSRMWKVKCNSAKWRPWPLKNGFVYWTQGCNVGKLVTKISTSVGMVTMALGESLSSLVAVQVTTIDPGRDSWFAPKPPQRCAGSGGTAEKKICGARLMRSTSTDCHGSRRIVESIQ